MPSELVQAAILGIVQGLTEFLPISSTGHLIIVPALLGWDDEVLHRLEFDIALHVGTFFAVMFAFWRDWFNLARAGIRSPFALFRRAPAGQPVGIGPARDEEGLVRDRSREDADARLAWLIVIGTIPAAVAGALFQRQVESVLRSPMIVGTMMVVVAIVLAIVDSLAKRDRNEYSLGPWGAFAIGVGQAIALIPGTSRSGSTIATALALGLTRESAARFSFLLSAPITFGAVVKQSVDVARHGLTPSEMAMFAVGALTAGIAGVLAIHALLRYLRTQSLMPFVIYRVIVGTVVIALAATGRLG
jgi:undecaprenyl-diphosphatase